jgi:biopolymer transport protein ExbB
MSSIQQAAASSGGILYLMGVLLLIAITVAIERSWYLFQVQAKGKALIKELAKSNILGGDIFMPLVENNPGLPHAKVLEAAIKHDLDHDFNRISDKLEESIMHEVPGIDRYLWVLDTIVTLAPLLGLLGTIIGMFNSFQILGDAGSAPGKVTGGVAEALLATASGLFIAIIGLVFLNGLNNRVRVVMHQLETLKMMLLNRIYPHYVENNQEPRSVKSLTARAAS